MGAEVSTEGGLDPLGLGAAEDPKAKAKKPKPKKKKKKVIPEGEEAKKVVKPSLKKPKKGAPKVDLDSPPMLLLEKIRSLARKPEFCDCIFFVGDKEFQGVRALIALQSAPLRALLYKDSAKIGSKTAVEISDVEPLIFRVFIDFLHTGRLAIPCRTVSSESVIPALKSLASRFEVTSLTRALAELQEDDLDSDNVLPLLLLARKYGDIELVEDCIHFIKYNAEYLFQDKQFIVDCPKDLLHELVGCDDLGAKESTVFQGLITWGQYRLEAGEEKAELSEIIAEFVPKIRMALLGGVFMFDYVIPLGLLTDEEIINLLCYQIDKKGFKNILKGKTIAERKRPAFKRRPRKKGGVSIQTRTLATALAITLRGGPSTPYTQTHDGGACIINGKIFTHYGNDSGGNRVYVIDVETNTHRTVNLPFQTHGSFPCTDRSSYVYVFEDSDSGHGNGFGRINVDSLEFERLRDAPGQHLRYSSCCFQGGRFWKFVNSYNIASYDPDSDNWETKVSVSSQGILMADPTDEDIIWIMFQGTTLSRYTISTNTLVSHNTGSQYFNLGANYPAFIMPSETGGVLIAMYSSSVWQLYNSETNTWSPTTGYPTVSEGGHCFYDLETGNMYFQNSGASSFQVA